MPTIITLANHAELAVANRLKYASQGKVHRVSHADTHGKRLIILTAGEQTYLIRIDVSEISVSDIPGIIDPQTHIPIGPLPSDID